MNEAASTDKDRQAKVPEAGPGRGVYVNRTLNLRSVDVIGYDMDYTLIHYDVDAWEGAAFEAASLNLSELGWPVEAFSFQPELFTIGLVFDLELGNLVKATRFGYVVRAQHGARVLSFDEQRTTYRNQIVELSSPRYEFMNTLFELSRASLFTQLVDLHDAGKLAGATTYADLYRSVDRALGEAHWSGAIKERVVADPDRFVDLDSGVVPTLLHQRSAGKRLALITNSDWDYTRQMMRYSFDRFCPRGTSWRDLFDLVVVSANKPRFFTGNDPIYRVVDEERSLLRPHRGPLESGHVYFGGNARLVGQSLGVGDAGGSAQGISSDSPSSRVSGRQPLYIGDHLFGDVHVTKDELHWRTALIARELEAEIIGAVEFEQKQARLNALMLRKVEVDRRQARLRLARASGDKVGAELGKALQEARDLDDEIGPLARAASEIGNSEWGPLMRAGNDKSLFARQVERYADVYMSRVSNLAVETPYGYLRAARLNLPHDLPHDGAPEAI